MVTVAEIAAQAFTAVSASITDAIQSATWSGGSGRVVFDMDKASGAFPSPEAKDRVETAYLEGFSSWPAEGDELTSGGVVYYILATRDIVKASGLYHVALASEADLLWKTVTVERSTNTSDGAGGFTKAWVPQLPATKGGIAALNGMEKFTSDRIEATSDWRLIMQHFDGLLPSDRIDIDGRKYSITFVNDVQKRGTWHVLDLTEGAAT